MQEFGFQWHITNFCNLRCTHCYQDDFTDDADLDTRTCKDMIDIIARSLPGVQIIINVTGGEPLLRDDIFDIFDHLEEVGAVKEYNIITNAIPLDKAGAARLERLAKLKQIKISLECSDSDLNDSIRGKGSFEKIIRNFGLISSKARILMYTLGSYNYQHARAMLFFSENLGADGVIIERFVPQGQARALRDQYLKRDEWNAVLRNVIEYAELNVTTEDLLPYKAFYIDLKNKREVAGALCNLGGESMALMPNGDVYPCRRTAIRIANILKDEFSDILLRLRLLRDSFDKNLTGICNGCGIKTCIGCRALAYAVTGNLYSEDLQCSR